MDVDIVVLWVDGSDPNWLKEKNQYSSDMIDDSNSDNRFRDWGLMKYWFRGIEQNAPWIRTIHFVTWGHLPEFLKVDHPKIHIVRHQDYIPSEWLPTFSSHALEMNIHRIPGLANHFIYFNDDTYLLCPMEKRDFFQEGMPCAQATEIPLGFIGKPEVWTFAAANDMGVINKHFSKNKLNKETRRKFLSSHYNWYDNVRTESLRILFPNYFTGFKSFHCPAAFLKETFEELWMEEPELLRLTSNHKFRDKEDVNQWLAQWWQLAKGKFSPRKSNTCNFVIQSDRINAICKAIENGQYEMISISDPENMDYDFEKAKMCLQKAFEKRFSVKSSFEKD